LDNLSKKSTKTSFNYRPDRSDHDNGDRPINRYFSGRRGNGRGGGGGGYRNTSSSSASSSASSTSAASASGSSVTGGNRQ